MVLPRVTTAMIKAGLHGWATNHRCGKESRRCILCNNYNDTLSHISRCSVTRELWRLLLPTLQFDNHAVLGFVFYQWTNDEIGHVALTTFGIYEFYRYWSHLPYRHTYSTTQCARAIAHFATVGLAGSRGSVTSSFIRKCRSLLTA